MKRVRGVAAAFGLACLSITGRAGAETVRDAPSDPEKRDEGLLGPVRLSALVGAGFPSLASGQIICKLHEVVALTGSAGGTPTIGLPFGASFAQRSFEATARVYPFRGAFFVGLGAGRSTVTGRATAEAYDVTGTASASTTTTFVLPEVGFVYRFSFGLTLGADFGVQIPVQGSTTSSAAVAGTNVALPEDVKQSLAALEKTPMPVFHFLRIGWTI